MDYCALARAAQGFNILLGPDVAFDDVTTTMLTGRADAAFFAALQRLREAGDDRHPDCGVGCCWLLRRFCMGMMFPLGLSLWRRHVDLLPFFRSADGITSMLASALGMMLSIAFGIARTYALAVCFIGCAR